MARPLDRARTIANLSSEKKELKVLTSRKNLILHGFLSDRVGSLVPYKKFHRGKVVKPKITEEGAEYWSDSENEDAARENSETFQPPETEGALLFILSQNFLLYIPF